jgi:hypothetical protein
LKKLSKSCYKVVKKLSKSKKLSTSKKLSKSCYKVGKELAKILKRVGGGEEGEGDL